MADDRRIELVVEADDQASRVLDDVAEKIEQLDEKVEVEVEADTRQAESRIERFERELDELTSASGRELRIEFRHQVLEQQIRSILRSLERLDDPVEIAVKQGELEAAQQEMRDLAELADRKYDVQVEVDPKRTARDAVDEIGRSADSSRSALANMIGNSTQDLAALGGVAGSTGVLFGQMGEYMADARLEGERFGSVIKNFALVAGPALALGAAIEIVGGLMADQAREAEEAAARTEEFGDAMVESADDAIGITDVLRSNTTELRNFNTEMGTFGSLLGQYLGAVAQGLPLVGGLFGDAGEEIVDIIPALRKAELSWYDVARAIENGGRVGDEWTDKMFAARDAGKLTGEEVNALIDFFSSQGKAAEDAAAGTDLWRVSQDEANAILQEMLKQQQPLAHFRTEWSTLMADMADGAIDTTEASDAINVLAEGLGLTQQRVIELAQAEIERKDATDGATEAVAAHFEALEGLNAGWDNIGEGTDAWGDIEDATDDAKRAVDDYDDTIAGLHTEQALLDIEDQWASMEEAAQAAWDAASTGAEDADERVRAHKDEVINTKLAYADLLTEQFKVKPEIVTDFIVNFDQFTKDQIDAYLDRLAKGIDFPIRPYVVPGGSQTGPGGVPIGPHSIAPPPAVTPLTVNVRTTGSMREVDRAISRWKRLNGGG